MPAAKKPTKAKTKRKRAPRTPEIFRPFMLVQMYRWAKAGWSLLAIAEELGTTEQTMHAWKKKRPEVAQTLELAHQERHGAKTFADYCLQRLPKELQELWARIETWRSEPDGIARIEQMMTDHGERVRQQLYIHALISCSFSPSRAGAVVGVQKAQLDRWIREEPEFADLIREIEWHKGNFFEESLIELVSAKEPQAILFANKTFNRERGYGNVLRIDGKVEHNHQHVVLDLADLMPYLNAEQRSGLMDALRRHREDAEQKKLVPVELPVAERLENEMAKVADAS